MSKSKKIRLLKDRLDYYTMEAEDDQFDAEEVIRLLKRLDEQLLTANIKNRFVSIILY